MKDEITKIITMVQEGKISSDEAGELISLLKDKSSSVTSNSYLEKMLKIRVQSGTKEKANVNIPVRLVKALLKMGRGIAANIPEAKEYVEDLDVDLIIQAIDQEIDGKIVDIETEKGEIISVSIE